MIRLLCFSDTFSWSYIKVAGAKCCIKQHHTCTVYSFQNKAFFKCKYHAFVFSQKLNKICVFWIFLFENRIWILMAIWISRLRQLGIGIGIGINICIGIAKILFSAYDKFFEKIEQLCLLRLNILRWVCLPL